MNLLINNSRASYYVGGTEVVSLHQAEGLARRGNHVLYLVRAVPEGMESGYFTDFETNIRQQSLPIEIGKIAIDAPYGNGHSWDIWNNEAHVFGQAAQDMYAKRLQTADVAVSHMSADALYVPHTRPHVLHLHGSPKQRDDLIDRSMVQPDRAIAHSNSIQEWWSSHYPDMPMDIFRNGVPIETFDHPVDSERPIDILYVGRLLEHKGVQDILAAADPSQRIVIAGSGKERDALQEYITEHSLNATIVDSPDNETLVELYKQAKIFACPSRGKEGVLTTMLEAGAAGCAIVTASGSGMTDLAVDRQNSRVVTPGDVDALTASFTELLADTPARLQLAATMQSAIHTAWSWDKKAEELEDLYGKAL